MRVDADLKKMINTMLDLMYEAKGVGLAANQVNLPLRLFVCNPAGNREEGEEFVFINPVISKHKGSEEGEEGCLSMPGLYRPVIRPASIHLQAYTLAGQQIDVDLDGFLARIVQHETDHLDGVIFTDRLSETGKLDVQDALEEFEMDFLSKQRNGQIPLDEDIAQHIRTVEERYGPKR